MTWQNVKDLQELTQLNLKICMDALDDAIKHLQNCREKFNETLGNIKDLKEKSKNGRSRKKPKISGQY